jgi:FkbM family methyltransferase
MQWTKIFNLHNKKIVDLTNFKLAVMLDDYIGSGIYSSRSYEPHVTKNLQELLQPGMTFVDIGANLGFFTMLASSLVGPRGKVFAFEPNPQNVELIKASIQANNFSNITLFELAVSDRETTLPFVTRDSNGGVLTEQFKQEMARSKEIIPATYNVQSVTLDEKLKDIEKIDVIKMDIEAHEPEALRGMRNLLLKHHPPMFVEFHPWALQRQSSEDPKTFLDNLVGLNYSLYVLTGNGQRYGPLSADDLMNHWRAVSRGNATIHLDLLVMPR